MKMLAIVALASADEKQQQQRQWQQKISVPVCAARRHVFSKTKNVKSARLVPQKEPGADRRQQKTSQDPFLNTKKGQS